MSINFQFPFRKGVAGGFAVNNTTITAVKDDLKILLLSNHGERPIHGDFGANLRRLIFEPGPNVTTRAEDLILAAIEKWMPFVRILELEVRDETDDNTVGPNELRIQLRFEVGQIEGLLDQRIRN